MAVSRNMREFQLRHIIKRFISSWITSGQWINTDPARQRPRA
jgi:hypothetical protein